MKLIKVNSQTRRDIYIDIGCEGCNTIELNVSVYDDRNYWDNVLPNKKCKSCKKSTFDMNLRSQNIATKYSEHEIV